MCVRQDRQPPSRLRPCQILVGARAMNAHCCCAWYTCRWLPSQAGAFVALCAGAAADAPGSLLAFDVARSTKAPLASALLARGAAQPRCLEVLVTSNGSSWVPVGTQHSSPPAGSSTQGTTAQVPVDVGVVVGFDDGSSSMFQLAQGWAEGRLPLHSSCSERTQTHAEQVKRLQELLVQ